MTRIADKEEQTYNIEHYKAYAAEAKAGIHGKAHEGLAYAGGIGVHKAAGEAHGRGKHYDRGAYHAIVTKAHEY